jgi:gamma-glutamylputrescine oxidase
LRGEQRADVCVIGAGFTGISTALHLAERGYNVHVVEANKVGWGASGRNGGQLIAGIAAEDRLRKLLGEKAAWELRWAGHEIIKERVSTYHINCDLKFGYIDVAIKKRHMRDLEKLCQRFDNHGLAHEHRLLSRSETTDLIGTDAYIGALLNMGNGHLHPLNLCIGEARAAVSKGATIYEQSPVESIEHGEHPVVHTASGLVKADFVVIAGNAYHRLEAKLRGQVLPVNSFIIGSEPLSEEIVNQINPQDLAVCDPNYILQYFRLSADKRLLFGGRCRYFGMDPEQIKAQLVPRLLKIYPQLRDTRFDYAWGGSIAVSANRAPQFGRVAPNVLYAQGYAGHGVNVTHVAGKILADAVAGTAESFDVFAKLRAARLPGAATYSRQFVELGMIFFGLRDKL